VACALRESLSNRIELENELYPLEMTLSESSESA
jgi:hypothetical protein